MSWLFMAFFSDFIFYKKKISDIFIIFLYIDYYYSVIMTFIFLLHNNLILLTFKKFII